MFSGRRSYLAIAFILIGAAATMIMLPAPVRCPHPNCREAVSFYWDFDSIPDRKMIVYSTPAGLSVIPTP